MAQRFNAASTDDEMLQGRDLQGWRFLVTGASAGVGLEMVKVVASHGGEVVGAVRDLDKAVTALRQAGLAGQARERVRLQQLDLASFASTRACADALLTQGDGLDVVIANAGVMAVPQGRTEDGFETQFATNYLGHFLLANRIAPLLKSGGRLVVVSSAGHRGADVDLDDPSFEQTPYDPLVAYRRSKTATVLFAVEFDRRHRGRGVRAAAVHPGAVLTDTTRAMIEAQPSAASAFTWKTAAQGAATPLWAALVASPEEIGGRYCEDCHVSAVEDDPNLRHGVRSYAVDPDRAAALWRKTEAMVGETFPGV